MGQGFEGICKKKGIKNLDQASETLASYTFQKHIGKSLPVAGFKGGFTRVLIHGAKKNLLHTQCTTCITERKAMNLLPHLSVAFLLIFSENFSIYRLYRALLSA